MSFTLFSYLCGGGALFLTAGALAIKYLCSNLYSLGDNEYRSALRVSGSIGCPFDDAVPALEDAEELIAPVANLIANPLELLLLCHATAGNGFVGTTRALTWMDGRGWFVVRCV